MHPHDGQPDALIDDPLDAVMWELRKGSRVARCELWRHPLGWELRCAVDNKVRQTAVQRRPETAEDLAHDWQHAFAGKGWS
ncbi:hypothetical protein LuPra_03904 [Luteitalea pratensis]|uniref:Uncharacterized protein n=1 Tax=Luteitalea pratensis TaxID=1855912 RepID=A0A143PQ01_LUTPR|nr:hypothetical protein [Luteitalea pratensis]AMY10665.1 hypothetical protein LuPra_03904 [Luteitalea pratensis]